MRKRLFPSRIFMEWVLGQVYCTSLSAPLTGGSWITPYWAGSQEARRHWRSGECWRKHTHTHTHTLIMAFILTCTHSTLKMSQRSWHAIYSMYCKVFQDFIYVKIKAISVSTFESFGQFEKYCKFRSTFLVSIRDFSQIPSGLHQQINEPSSSILSCPPCWIELLIFLNPCDTSVDKWSRTTLFFFLPMLVSRRNVSDAQSQCSSNFYKWHKSQLKNKTSLSERNKTHLLRG